MTSINMLPWQHSRFAPCNKLNISDFEQISTGRWSDLKHMPVMLYICISLLTCLITTIKNGQGIDPGGRDSGVVRAFASHQCTPWPGSDSQTGYRTRVEFVGSLL